MRLLLYNRVQFDDKRFRGGGVTLYLKNLIRQLTNEKNIKITFLSSGTSYNIFKKKTYWRKTKNIFENKGVESYEIVNSPIKAPAHDSFGLIEECLISEKISNVFVDFIRNTGDYDILHLHNIEGLSVKCIEAFKKKFQKKIIYTFHNYHLLCPQIELFRYGKEICFDFEEGAACLSCLETIPNPFKKKYGQGIADIIEQFGLSEKPLGEALFRISANCHNLSAIVKNYLSKRKIQTSMQNNSKSMAIDYLTLIKQQTSQIKKLYDIQIHYKNWRVRNIETINKLVDCTIAVSNQVKDCIVSFGVEKRNIEVVHNGMDIFKKKDQRIELYKKKNNRRVNIAFFGYPIPSKGLDFFIEGFLKIENKEFIKKTKISIVSRLNDQIRRKLIRLLNKGYELSILQGYERSILAKLMEDIDLGVIPSLWLETYNQVGYEMIMHGVPVLLSDTVGIKDFINDKEKFLFKSGDLDDFINKIIPLVIENDRRSAFWNQDLDLPDMEKHTREIKRIYKNCHQRKDEYNR